MSLPNYYEKDGKWTIECPNCLKNNIIVRIETDNKKLTEDLWNNRAYDKYIYDNIDNLYDILKNQNIMTLKNEDCEKIFDTLRLENINEGCFVTPNGDIINCNHNHIFALYEYLDLDPEYSPRDWDPTLCLKFNLARLSIFTNILAIDIPEKYKKIQIDVLIKLLCENKYKNINKFYLQIKNNNDTKQIEYNNINDLILQLDKLK